MFDNFFAVAVSAQEHPYHEEKQHYTEGKSLLFNRCIVLSCKRMLPFSVSVCGFYFCLLLLLFVLCCCTIVLDTTKNYLECCFQNRLFLYMSNVVVKKTHGFNQKCDNI